MKTYTKTIKLQNVGYDIRGPVSEEAARMVAEGIDVIPLNTGNPATFGLFAPDFVEEAMRAAVRAGEPYSDSAGISEAREAVAVYCRSKGISGVCPGDVFTGNGVSEMINIALQALLDDGDEVLLPARGQSGPAGAR